MNKQRFIVLIILLLLVGSGCWGRIEVEDWAMITGLGLDREEEDKIKFTAQTLIAGEIPVTGEPDGEAGGEAIWVLSSTGVSMLEAARSFIAQTGRRLLWSHVEVVVFGEELSRRGIAPYLDWLDREELVRRRVWMAAAPGSAGDIIRARHPLENIPSQAIADMFYSHKYFPVSTPRDLRQVIQILQTPGKELTLPALKIIEQVEEHVEPRVRLWGTAVYKKDTLVGWLDRRHSRGLLWILGEMEQHPLVLNCPGKEDGKITLKPLQSDSKVSVNYAAEIIKGQVEIKVLAVVEEIFDCQPFPGIEVMEEIRQMMEQEIRAEALETINSVQEQYAADIFGFGESLYRQDHVKWNRIKESWSEIFAGMQVEVEVKAELRGTGLLTSPLAPR